MSTSHTHGDNYPNAHETIECPPPLPHMHHFSGHPGNAACYHREAVPCGHHSIDREGIQRLTHRASFAESAFYAILNSHALKDKDQAAEATKLDRLIEGVGVLSQQSLTLSQVRSNVFKSVEFEYDSNW